MRHTIAVLAILTFGSFHAGADPVFAGRVRLPSGAPVPGAQVLLFDLADLRAPPLATVTDQAGHFTLSMTKGLPGGFELGANYPNPFNPSTVIPTSCRR